MPALTPAACVDGLYNLLNGMTGIGAGGVGMVHKYRRIVRDEAAIKSLFVGANGNGKVNGWMISPAPTNTTVTERHPGFNAVGVPGAGNAITTFQFQIEGHYQIDDGAQSEITFRDLAWSVADTINSYGVLNIAGAIFQTPADVEQFGFILIANTGFYHYARIGCGFRGRTRP